MHVLNSQARQLGKEREDEDHQGTNRRVIVQRNQWVHSGSFGGKQSLHKSQAICFEEQTAHLEHEATEYELNLAKRGYHGSYNDDDNG